jgi:hypothetical protein
MQPATADQVASEAALLSREQLQSLARAANVLGREVEEVTSDVTYYVQRLQGLSLASLTAATCVAVHYWLDRTAGVEAVAAGLPTATVAAGPPATRSGRSDLDQKKQCSPSHRRLCNWRFVKAKKTLSTEPYISWRQPWKMSSSPSRSKLPKRSGLRPGGRSPFRRSGSQWRPWSGWPWTPGRTPPSSRSLADEVLESAPQVIDDQSTDCTLGEVDEELELMSRHGQQLRELLDTGKKDGFVGHLEYEEAKKAVLEEVQAQVTGAESWLEKARADL